jgi:hypothetical protein
MRPHPLLFFIAFLLGLLGLRSVSLSGEGDLFALHYGVWGDWSAHFTFISSYMHREWGWWLGDSPLAVGQPFRYPSLSHAMTALLAKVCTSFGADPVRALIACTRYSSTLLLVALPFLYDRVTRDFIPSPAARMLGFFVFAFSGSFGLELLNLAGSENQFASHWPDQGAQYGNPIIAGLLPQRAMLFGVTQALLAVLVRKRSLALSGLLLGLLPFMHVHTWIVSVGVMGVMSVFQTKEVKRNLLSPTFLVPFITASSIGCAFLFRGAALTSWDLFAPGWLLDSKNLLSSIFRNFTFTPVLFYVAVWKTKGTLRSLGIAGLSLFLLCLFVKLQPFHWDNIKVMWLAIGLASCAASETLMAWLTHPKLSIKIRSVAIITYMTLPAVIDHYRAHAGVQKVLFYDALELKSASNWIPTPHDVSGTLCGTTRHNHWLPTLTGQPVVRGFEGWLWTWGIDYTKLPDPMVKDSSACHYWIDDTKAAKTAALRNHTLLTPIDLRSSTQ